MLNFLLSRAPAGSETAPTGFGHEPARTSGTPVPLISLRNVGKRFETRSGTKITALDDVSIDIKADEFITLVGQSGCGKSTLMKLIGGVIKPSSGEIFLAGERLTKSSRAVGMVFQRSILLPWRTVLGNILFPIEMLGWRVQDYRKEAARLIDIVGLRGFESAFPGELSGGMQQRASICRALIYDPQVLLMDEPFGALDAMTREDMSLEVMRIWTERRKTVVFVTHSINEAVLLADRVIVMKPRPGKVVMDLKIDLPRPRSLSTEFLSAFQHYVEMIRAAIYVRHEAAGRG